MCDHEKNQLYIAGSGKLFGTINADLPILGMASDWLLGVNYFPPQVRL